MTKWVYADGSVGSLAPDQRTQDEYAPHGLTFEGEMIYAHKNYTVEKRAALANFFTATPDAKAVLRAKVEAVLRKDFFEQGRQVVELSEQYIDPSTPDAREELLSNGMFALAYRLLIAVKKA